MEVKHFIIELISYLISNSMMFFQHTVPVLNLQHSSIHILRKRSVIYKSLTSESSSCCLSFDGIILDSFKPATEDEIRSIILIHGIKCSPEDSIPAQLLRNCFDVFI